jgi:phosphotransferase system enzyme I (PtsI)
MNRGGDLPGEDEQFEAYRKRSTRCRAARDDPHGRHWRRQAAWTACRRTSCATSMLLNPALGLRAIRWSLSEPGMFRQQLRAILRASAHGKVRILCRWSRT